MKFRGFVAVDLLPGDRLLSLAHDLGTSGADLKLVRMDQLHLTLKFLGDTEEGLTPEIVASIAEACRGIEPFVVRLQGTGAFPSLSRINVIWVGILGGEPLGRIAVSLDASLDALGFPRENRPWSPHATLARAKSGRGLDRVREILETYRDEAFGDQRIDRVRLKKSVLTPTGPVYSTIEEVPLAR